MVTSSADAKGILEGIVSLACKLSNVDLRKYTVKIGGDQLGDRANIDWYASVQNVSGSINTAKARKLGLVRTTFSIRQADPAESLKLLIREWSALRDWKGDYRVIWEVDENMQSRKEMAEIMADAINRAANH